MLPYLVAFVGALLASVALTPLVRAVSRRWNVVAVPGGRRKHRGMIPKLGGISILGGYLVGVATIYLLLPPDLADDALRLRGVVLGSLLVFAGGILDDRYDLPPRAQFAIQIAGALVANWHIVFLERFANPFQGTGLIAPLDTIDVIVLPTWLAWLVTTVWIVGMINAVNWLDGLDGLATGVGAIAALVFAWHAWQLGQTTVAAFPLALAGALLGFLLFNFAPARLFLGSAGVYVLAYSLATLAFLAPAKLATALLVLALPLLDGVWRVIDRLRRGYSPLRGDRGHLHFVLLDRGWPVRRIVLVYYAVAAGFGLVALLAPSGLVKFVVLALLAVVLLGVIVWLTARAPL